MKLSNLSIEQVNANLNKYFSGKGGLCTDTFKDTYTDGINYKIAFNGKRKDGSNYEHDLLITSKKVVMIAANEERQNEYLECCDNCRKISTVYRYESKIYIPFVWDKKTLPAEMKQQNNDLLICVGYAKDKTEAKTDLQRLQEFKIPAYVQFYKLIKEITVLRAEVRKDQVYAGYGKYVDGLEKIHITHKTGSFSFPIENIDTQAITKQIRAIFFNLVGIAQETEIKPELSPIMYVAGNGTLKAKKAIGRLLKHKVAA